MKRHADRDTSVEDCEQEKQEGRITITDNTLSTKIIEQYFSSVCELEILNYTRILCHKS